MKQNRDVQLLITIGLTALISGLLSAHPGPMIAGVVVLFIALYITWRQ
jgi:hypothetical protein